MPIPTGDIECWFVAKRSITIKIANQNLANKSELSNKVLSKTELV